MRRSRDPTRKRALDRKLECAMLEQVCEHIGNTETFPDPAE
jgi:hypothetical protein